MKTRLLALACALAPAAAIAQVRPGLRTPEGTTVGMGTVTKSPEQLLRERRATFERLMGLAEEYMRKEQWSDARENAKLAGGFRTTSDDGSRVVKLLVDLNAEGVRQIAAARRLYKAGEYKKTLQELRRISYQFAELEAGVRAAGLVKQAAHDPKMKAGLEETRAAGLTQLIELTIVSHYRHQERLAEIEAASAGPTTRPAKDPTAAPEPAPPAGPKRPGNMPAARVDQIRGLPIDKQARVLELLVQLAKLFPASASGQAAAEDVLILQADQKFMAGIHKSAAAREAKRAYSKAQLFHNGGLHKRAVELYRDLIQKFPDSPEAKKAETQVRLILAGAAPSTP